VSLDALGVTAEILSHFEPFAAAGCILGRVANSIRDEYRVLAACGELRAEPAGAFLYGAAGRADLPAVGDWVALRVADDCFGVVTAVLPRHTCFSRRAAGRREDEQLIAANVDTALVVCGLDHDFNLRRLERYLTVVHESGAAAVIVLSKADVCADAAFKVDLTKSIARDVPVIAVSSVTDVGFPELRSFLRPHKTFVLAGSSGAGKSTLINRLLGEERLRTSAVRESDGRGRHTTTARELIVLPSGAILIDTPGMRELQLWAGEESVERTFDEIADLAQFCKYRDCTHNSEDGCAVRDAVPPDRLHSYHKLQREVRYHETASDGTAAAVQKAKWKTIHKAAKAMYKHRLKG
jgi:ribosome biogenesis GTPase / thiamine phosphate phosphatase